MTSRRVRERIEQANQAAHALWWPIDDVHVLNWTMTERLDELIRRQDETDEAMQDVDAGMSDRQLRAWYGALFERLGLN